MSETLYQKGDRIEVIEPKLSSNGAFLAKVGHQGTVVVGQLSEHDRDLYVQLDGHYKNIYLKDWKVKKISAPPNQNTAS